MIRLRLLPIALLASLAAACADPAPPTADPALVERLLARLEAERTLPPAIAEKVEKADRVAGTVARIQPEKIDPDIAVALIAR